MDDLLNMVAGNSSNANKIHREKTHGTWDNYFWGDLIFDWVG